MDELKDSKLIFLKISVPQPILTLPTLTLELPMQQPTFYTTNNKEISKSEPLKPPQSKLESQNISQVQQQPQLNQPSKELKVYLRHVEPNPKKAC